MPPAEDAEQRCSRNRGEGALSIQDFIFPESVSPGDTEHMCILYTCY